MQIGSAVGPVLEQAQKLVQEGPAKLKEFEQLLSDLQQHQQTGKVGGGQLPQAQSLTTDKINAADSRVREITADKLKIAQTPEGVRQLGAELESGYKRLNELVKNLECGRAFTPQELLKVQGEMHEISMHIEVTTKVVSEVVSGLKQLMQQQI